MIRERRKRHPLREFRDSLSNAAQKLIGVENGFFGFAQTPERSGGVQSNDRGGSGCVRLERIT